MFERILFPTDFSEVSQKAAEEILRIPEVKEIHVLHILDENVEAAPRNVQRGIGPTFDEALERHRASLQGRIAELTDKFTAAGLSARSSVVEGDAIDIILDTAKADGSTAIVIGATPKTGLGGLLLGSVSDKVVHRAAVPVLIIKLHGRG